MSLQTFEETRLWGKAIARMVTARSMPPWFATAATRGQFHAERALADAQIETLARWASAGASARLAA